MRDARDKDKRSLRDIALRMLARREHSRAEVAARLARSGADAEEVARLLDELERLGYLSDARFAQMLVAQKAGRFGRRAIAHALAQKGIAANEARTALDDTLQGRDELAEATALWHRRFTAAPRDERERARAVRFLMARGYSLSTALAVMRAARIGSDEAEG